LVTRKNKNDRMIRRCPRPSWVLALVTLSLAVFWTAKSYQRQSVRLVSRILTSKFQGKIVIFLDMDGVISVYPLENDDRKPSDDEYDEYFLENKDEDNDDDDVDDDGDDLIELDYDLGEHCSMDVPSRTLAALSLLLEGIPKGQRKVVLSSAWRLSHTCRQRAIDYFAAYGEEHGGPLKHLHEFAGFTGDGEESRQQEIVHWLQKHHHLESIAAWIVLDDRRTSVVEEEEYRELFKGHVVITGKHVGLTNKKVYQALSLIRKQLEDYSS